MTAPVRDRALEEKAREWDGQRKALAKWLRYCRHRSGSVRRFGRNYLCTGCASDAMDEARREEAAAHAREINRWRNALSQAVGDKAHLEEKLKAVKHGK